MSKIGNPQTKNPPVHAQPELKAQNTSTAKSNRSCAGPSAFFDLSGLSGFLGLSPSSTTPPNTQIPQPTAHNTSATHLPQEQHQIASLDTGELDVFLTATEENIASSIQALLPTDDTPLLPQYLASKLTQALTSVAGPLQQQLLESAEMPEHISVLASCAQALDRLSQPGNHPPTIQEASASFVLHALIQNICALGDDSLTPSMGPLALAVAQQLESQLQALGVLATKTPFAIEHNWASHAASLGLNVQAQSQNALALASMMRATSRPKSTPRIRSTFRSSRATKKAPLDRQNLHFPNAGRKSLSNIAAALESGATKPLIDAAYLEISSGSDTSDSESAGSARSVSISSAESVSSNTANLSELAVRLEQKATEQRSSTTSSILTHTAEHLRRSQKMLQASTTCAKELRAIFSNPHIREQFIEELQACVPPYNSSAAPYPPEIRTHITAMLEQIANFDPASDPTHMLLDALKILAHTINEKLGMFDFEARLQSQSPVATAIQNKPKLAAAIGSLRKLYKNPLKHIPLVPPHIGDVSGLGDLVGVLQDLRDVWNACDLRQQRGQDNELVTLARYTREHR